MYINLSNSSPITWQTSVAILLPDNFPFHVPFSPSTYPLDRANIHVPKLVHVVSPISCCKEKQLQNCAFHMYILRAPYKIFLSEINRAGPSNFLFVVQQPKAGLGRLIIEVSSRGGLLWTTDHFVTGAATYATQQTEVMTVHVLNRIRTRDTSNQAAVNLSLNPHVHWDLLFTPWNILRSSEGFGSYCPHIKHSAIAGQNMICSLPKSGKPYSACLSNFTVIKGASVRFSYNNIWMRFPVFH